MTTKELSQPTNWRCATSSAVAVCGGYCESPVCRGGNRAMTKDEVDQAAELYRSGLTISDVAAKLDRPWSTVHTVLERRGVGMRSKHDYRYALKRVTHRRPAWASTGRVLVVQLRIPLIWRRPPTITNILRATFLRNFCSRRASRCWCRLGGLVAARRSAGPVPLTDVGRRRPERASRR